QTNARLVNGAVDRQQRVPGAVTAQSFLERLVRFRRRRRAGSQRLVETEIEFGRDVFRVQLSRQRESLRRILESSQFLQFDPPPVQRSRIPAANHARLTYSPADQSAQPLQSRSRVGPEFLIFVNERVGQRRGRDEVCSIGGEVVNQAVGPQIKQLEVVAKTGMQIINRVAADQLAHLIHQVAPIKGRGGSLSRRRLWPALGKTPVQQL